MRRITSLTTGVVVAVVLLAASAVPVHAQGALTNKRTFLTFSGPVEVPGTTLPAGRYIFQITNIASQTVWQVLDATDRRLLTQFFYVETRDRTTQEQNAADNRPIGRFHEAPQGMQPAETRALGRLLFRKLHRHLAGEEMPAGKEHAFHQLEQQERAEEIADCGHHSKVPPHQTHNGVCIQAPSTTIQTRVTGMNTFQPRRMIWS